MKPVIIIAIAFVFLFVPITTFAESESMIVAARSYERIQIYMNSGDELEFSIQVDGGKNDDINLIVMIPGEDIVEGRIIKNHSDKFTAPSSGTYVFTFDNTISNISNKSVLFSYDITKNTYYVYIENIPEYAKDHASNAVLDATEYWKSVFAKKNFYVADSQSEADIIIQWVKDFTGMSHVGFQYIRLIEIGLGDSSCLGQWNPYSSKHVTEITTHEIGHAIGLEHNNDPNSIMYPTASSTEYGNVSQQFNMGKNQGMFIPFCLSQEPSSIQYNVETTDPKSGFDVYTVPSKKDFDNLIQGNPFVYYSDEDCFGEGYLEYFGKCKGVINESGLAIIHDQDLSSPTASITVNYFEIDYNGYSSPFDTKVHSQIHETATIEVIMFGVKIDFSYSMYQNQDNFIRFEDGDGSIIHRYDAKSTIKNLFNSFGMSLTSDCLVISNGGNFCNNDDYSLKFLVNGKTLSSLSQYVFNDGDRIKIIYESIPKVEFPIGTATNTPSESKPIDSAKISSESTNKIVCGKGTIEKNGQCVIDTSKTIESEKSSKGGGCLIATATYGSELAPQVQQLRELRDNKLLNTKSGTSFMESFNQFYYSFSPTIADLERENPIFKETVKIIITPLLTSLSLLNYVDMDSEAEVLGYGISLILLNVGMYFVAPTLLIIGIYRKHKPQCDMI